MPNARLLLPLTLANFVAVSTLYWGQAVVPRAVHEFGPSAAVSLMPGAALAGYAAGVAGLAMLAGDLTAPRGLAWHVGLLAASLGAAAAAPSPVMLALCCFCIGAGCAMTQRLLACGTSLVGADRRAQTIGWIIASGLCGIVLARSFVPTAAELLGWRGVFWADAAAACLAGLGALHAACRIDRGGQTHGAVQPPGGTRLWRGEAVLRRAALEQASVFAAFNMGWAIFPRVLRDATGWAPLWMAGVATLGAGAALAAGRLCAVWPSAAVARAGGIAVAVACAALVPALMVPAYFGLGMALLDTGTQVALVANHARAQALVSTPSLRGRVAAIVTTVGFAGGAIGAAVGNLLAWTGLIPGL